VVRRGETLWAIPRDAVAGVAKRDRMTLVATRAGEVAADDVVELVDALVVRRPGGAIAAFLAPGVAGLAVHEGVCIAVVDPLRPPDALRSGVSETPPARSPVRRRRRKGTAGAMS
jgi:hypothetical protein